MLKLIIAIIISVLMCYELNKLIFCFLEDKNEMRERIFYILIIFGMFVITFYYKMNDFVVIICYGIGLLLLELNISAEIKQKTLCFVYSFCILTAIQLMATMTMENKRYVIGDQLALRQMMISIMQLLIINVLRGRKKNRPEIKIPIPYWILFLLVPIFSLHFISLLLQSHSISIVNIILGTVGILTIDFTVVAMYQALSDSYEQLLEKKIYKEQSRYYEKQLLYITESYQTVRSVKHDIKNILNAIKNMICEKKYDKILCYIDEINNSAGFNTTYVDTGNSAVDGILNYQIQRARNLHIDLKCKAGIPEQLNMDEIDMSILLGNIIDNAIEATSKMSEESKKEIIVNLQMKKENLFIDVINPYEGEILRDGQGNIISTKENHMEHGIGLNNVKKVVDKYHGQMLMNDCSQIFTTQVVLYISC